MKKLLLISNSTQSGTNFLDHCSAEIQDFLGNAVKTILFVPFASGDHDGYASKVRERLQLLGFQIASLHESADPIRSVETATAIFIGGGNTFRLLNSLYSLNILATIRKKVNDGVPYIGISAGTNVACPSIKTTNDMPIIYPPSFEALNLIPFNINPHYIDPEPALKHQGETREQRIKEFHELNNVDVVGLREGTMLNIVEDNIQLTGIAPAAVFRRGKPRVEYEPGSALDFLLIDLSLPKNQ